MGAEKAVPGEGEAGLEPTKFPYEDGEGHSEADAQKNMHQLITPSVRVSSVAPSEKGTLVESSCPKWRKKALVPRPEDGHMVIMVVRQVTGPGL